MPKPQVMIAGHRYGRLTVLSFHSFNPTKWVCKCDCGNTCIVYTKHLRIGHTTSCGCRLKELLQGAMRRSHGDAPAGHPSKEYRTWASIKRRCYAANIRTYQDYGARGITVCDRWRNNFPAFLADMGRCPIGHSIERRDNELGYFPENCYWATSIEQHNNTRASRRLTLNGVTRTVAQWCRVTGLKSTTIRQRLDASGWTVEKALTTPVNR